jgi:hypothetical protein
MRKLNYALCFCSLFVGCAIAPQGSQKNTGEEKKSDSIHLKSLKAQPYKKLLRFKKDTLAYLRYNFVERKEVYLHKPAKLLLLDLELPVIDYFCSGGDPPRLNEINGFYLQFEKDITRITKTDAKIIPNMLFMKFTEPIDGEHSTYLSRKYQGSWVQQTSDYFGSIVIDDIMMIRF